MNVCKEDAAVQWYCRFCKRNCSEKLCKIHGKTFVMETFFSNVTGLTEGTKKVSSNKYF